MLIGIIGDTHDNLRHLDKAMQYFNKQKIAYLHSAEKLWPKIPYIF